MPAGVATGGKYPVRRTRPPPRGHNSLAVDPSPVQIPSAASTSLSESSTSRVTHSKAWSSMRAYLNSA